MADAGPRPRGDGGAGAHARRDRLEPLRLNRVAAADAAREHRGAVDLSLIGNVLEITESVRERGEAAVRDWGERLGDLRPGDSMILGPDRMKEALRRLSPSKRGVLERVAARIKRFARAQLRSAVRVDIAVDGGRAGDRPVPVGRAGCYAPGGRFPLPSSVLMTALPARVAGVEEVWLASPKPSVEVLAAGAIAGASGLLAVGGAQAIAALAYGVPPVPPCDVVVGPGNTWVTVAKFLLSGVVGIDLLAGPSELAVVTDGQGDPGLIAADMLAQAEHDPEALVALISTDSEIVERVELELARRVESLPTAAVALASLRHAFAVVATEDEALRCCERLAPEHVQLHGGRAERWARQLQCYGTVFVGDATAEVLGDYGAGPNHTLPTGGTARFAGGLSALSFLRRPTWLHLRPGQGLNQLARDSAAIARMEGLEAHARAAEARIALRTGQGLRDAREESG